MTATNIGLTSIAVGVGLKFGGMGLIGFGLALYIGIEVLARVAR